MKLKKYAALGLAIIAPLGLSGCLILPGEFTSEMTVLKSGEFSFSYKGQIQLLGLANILNQSLNEEFESAEFEATCWVGSGDDDGENQSKDDKDDNDKKKSDAKKEKALAKNQKNAVALGKIKTGTTSTAASASAEEDYDLAQEEKDAAKSNPDEADADTDEEAEEAVEAVVVSIADEEESYDLKERDCTEKEIAQQKKEWDETQEAKKKSQEEQKEFFAQMLGGIDPKDPKTIERFTKEVERLSAWHKVEHLGDGLFMIDYSTKGQLADDFAFPVIPRYALGQPMIHITRWDNGRLRVEAPSFHTDPDFSLMAMAGSSAMMGMTRGGKGPNVKPVTVKGTFTLFTDARILANNTEEGPEETGSLKKLFWDVGPEIFGPPMALLKLN